MQERKAPATKHLVRSLAGIAIVSTSLLASNLSNAQEWPAHRPGFHNASSRAVENSVRPSTAGQLKTKWVFTTRGYVSATPTRQDDRVYLPDSAGFIYAIRSDTGKRVWSHKISAYNHQASAISLTSPAIYENKLIFGDSVSRSIAHNGAHIMAVDRSSGKLLWITRVDSHPAATITAAPVLYGSTLFVGVSSNEEALARHRNYRCCTFRGSMVALDANTGKILWKSYTVPPNGGQAGGYSGGAISGYAAIDPIRGSVYASDNGNYTVPRHVLHCAETAITAFHNLNCIASDDHVDAGLSFDMRTGAIKWAHVLCGLTRTRNPGGERCPLPNGPDYGFTTGVELFGNLIGMGQKSGIYWALNAADGSIAWATSLGPGSTFGGIEWSTARDRKHVYVEESGAGDVAYTLAGGQTIRGRSWAALDPHTGKILWQIADPSKVLDLDTVASSPNRVVMPPALSGNMYSLNAADGSFLQKFNNRSATYGPSIAQGTTYVEKQVYAFTLVSTTRP